MIEVFKTNVQAHEQCGLLTEKLQAHVPASRISFDLEDCDRILRIEAESIAPDVVIAILHAHGFECAVLS